MKNIYTWLKPHTLWMGFNLSAGAIYQYTVTHGSPNVYPRYSFDPELESGKWAIRFLLVCLTMTPLRTYFNWKQGIKLRKSAGLWSFVFACTHVYFAIEVSQFSWFRPPLRPFIVWGLTGLVILSALALTSNRFAMRTLRKNWKRLHRLVYFAGVAVITHAMLATEASKKLLGRELEPIHELRVYLGILIGLLVIRIPLVRWLLKMEWVRPRKMERVVELPREQVPQFSPKRNGHGYGHSNGHGGSYIYPIPNVPVEEAPAPEELEPVVQD